MPSLSGSGRASILLSLDEDILLSQLIEALEHRPEAAFGREVVGVFAYTLEAFVFGPNAWGQSPTNKGWLGNPATNHGRLQHRRRR